MGYRHKTHSTDDDTRYKGQFNCHCALNPIFPTATAKNRKMLIISE
jgi:hypothetical protein